VKNIFNPQEKAFWRAVIGVISLGVSIGLAVLILKL
tara:strand:+ start:1003 stop:1110 length:108 start_codon:yes stop_codon:yes gene_type:complete